MLGSTAIVGCPQTGSPRRFSVALLCPACTICSIFRHVSTRTYGAPVIRSLNSSRGLPLSTLSPLAYSASHRLLETLVTAKYHQVLFFRDGEEIVKQAVLCRLALLLNAVR